MQDQPAAAEKKARGRPKGTGALLVYRGLRDDILHVRLPPGSNIEEATLEKRFAVSRTPVREALIRLASEGLVTLLPNRGAQVTQIDISDVPQFFEALDVCQRMVMRLSAARRTDEQVARLTALNEEFKAAADQRDVVQMSELNLAFHTTQAAACGNKYVATLYEDLLSVGLRLARSAFGTALTDGQNAHAYYSEVVAQHEDMIAALAAGDKDKAEALGREHAELFRRRIVFAIEAGLAGAIDVGGADG